MTPSKLIAIAALCGLLAVSGCGKNKGKEQVYQHWNAARASAHGSLAAERYKLGNLDDSRKAIDEAIKLDPKNPQYHVLSAKLYIERNQLEQADQELAVTRKLSPLMAEADYLTGIIYQRWQKPELALQYYKDANEKAPGELAYLMARAEMLVLLNRTDEATTLLESKLTYFEYSGPLRDMLGTIYIQQGKLNDAISMLNQASILAPDDVTIKERLVRAEFRAKKYREALAQVTQLLENETYANRADLYLLKGECHVQLEQWREARFALETALEKNSTLVPALLSLAKVSLKGNDFDRADICLRRAASITPDDPQIHLGVGYMRLQQKRLPEALTAFEKASTLAPKDPVALCMIGLVHEKAGRSDKAMEYYGKAIQLDPADPLARQLMSQAR